MKKFILLLLLSMTVVLFFSCAERPDIDETEETEEETEYTPPEKDYLTKLAEDKGYHDFPDSIHCYTKPLIASSEYVPKSDLTFDTSDPTDERFLSCSYRYEMEIISGGDAYIDEHANASYLTMPNGERRKLCPYQWCREEFEEKCTHIDLVSGKVIDNYVYFIGENTCVGSPNHPDRAQDNGNINMLLRYSLETHKIEKVLTLPGMSFIQFAAYGVLYLNVRDETRNTHYYLLLDCDNLKVAESSAPYGGIGYHTITEDFIYYLDSNYRYERQTLYRCHPDLTEYEKIHEFQNGNYRLLGEYRGNLYLTREYNASDETTEPIKRTMFEAVKNLKTDILRLSRTGNTSVLRTDVFRAILTDGVLYTTDLSPRKLFDMKKPDGRRDETDLGFYTNCGTTITAHKLSLNGTVRASETVFDETVHSSEESLLNIQKYGNSILAITATPPTLPNYAYVYHKYHLTDETVVEIGEGNSKSISP